MVDLHFWSSTGVTWVHVEDYVCPLLLRVVNLAVCAAAVPAIDLVGGAYEAASRDAGVDDSGLEHFRVGSCHDVLGGGISVGREIAVVTEEYLDISCGFSSTYRHHSTR